MNKIDLHIHSSHSDGTNSFKRIIEMCKSKNIHTISITDHNTMEGYIKEKDVIQKELESNDINIIPGVEIQTKHKGVPIEILAYDVDAEAYQNLPLTTEHWEVQNITLQKLKEKFNIKEDIKLDIFAHSTLYRHMVEKDILKNKTGKDEEELNEIDFLTYCKQNKDINIHTNTFYPELEELLKYIKPISKKIFIAHPMLYEPVLDLEGALKLVDGLELLHPSSSISDIKTLRNLRTKHNKSISGGSDTHCNLNTLGSYNKPNQYDFEWLKHLK